MLLLNAFCGRAAPRAPPVVEPGQPTPHASARYFASDTCNQRAEHHDQRHGGDQQGEAVGDDVRDVGEDGR
jgi:hypothetical protein